MAASLNDPDSYLVGLFLFCLRQDYYQYPLLEAGCGAVGVYGERQVDRLFKDPPVDFQLMAFLLFRAPRARLSVPSQEQAEGAYFHLNILLSNASQFSQDDDG
ncbi:MAG: hypothetical protein AAB037_00155, partial [Chloroflexota bacterium]